MIMDLPNDGNTMINKNGIKGLISICVLILTADFVPNFFIASNFDVSDILID